MSGDQTSRDQMGMEIKRECAVGDQMGMEIECPRSNVRDQMSGDQMSRDQMRTTLNNFGLCGEMFKDHLSGD